MKILFSLRSILLVFIVASSCSSPHLGKPGESAKTYVFPYGKYQHDVHLTITPPAPNPSQSFRLNGVVRIEPEVIQVVGLSAFGSTMFQITEQRETGKIQTEVYVSQLKDKQDKLESYYGVLKQLLALKKGPDVHAGSVLNLKDGSTITLGIFDENQIPKTMGIRSKNFDVQIEVTHYAL